jgi:hypothetical protein
MIREIKKATPRIHKASSSLSLSTYGIPSGSRIKSITNEIIANDMMNHMIAAGIARRNLTRMCKSMDLSTSSNTIANTKPGAPPHRNIVSLKNHRPTSRLGTLESEGFLEIAGVSDFFSSRRELARVCGKSLSTGIPKRRLAMVMTPAKKPTQSAI